MGDSRAIGIIPARIGSTRFPGKVLADATGQPLIQHVYEAASRAHSLDRVVIATDDDRVRVAVESFGAECVMTSPDHPNGTSRLGEACEVLGLSDQTIVVNVQGDEPELDARIIDGTVRTLEASGAPVATAAFKFGPGDDPDDPHVVKVVRRCDGAALYFSRSHIPHPGGPGPSDSVPLHHVGLYAYRRAFLRCYGALEPTPLELAERLEQLRILEHGYVISVAVVPAPPQRAGGIDTPEQYEAFVGRWRAQHPQPS